jgi:hypothetical protein
MTKANTENKILMKYTRLDYANAARNAAGIYFRNDIIMETMPIFHFEIVLSG